MSISNRAFFLLSLMPAPWFCKDFIPFWFAGYLNCVLLIRLVRPIPLWVLFPASLFATYYAFAHYGNRLVPETAISFLNAMLVLKFGGKSLNFRTEVILGFLWTGSFAVFNNTLYYLLYLAAFFYIGVQLLARHADADFQITPKSFHMGPIKSLLKTLPLIAALFIFFPRFRGFIPSANSAGGKAEVGYSKTIDNSSANSLNLSSKTAFYAEINQRLPGEALYWRGRIHTKTDGYNWQPEGSVQDKPLPLAAKNSFQYVVKKEQSLEGDLPVLETPIRLIQGSLRHYQSPGSNTYRTYSKNKKSLYTAVSSPEGNVRSSRSVPSKQSLQLPQFLPKAFREFTKGFRKVDAKSIVSQFALKIKKDKFEYTLAPGPIPTLNDFLEAKKGFCTHYASLLALTLRHFGVPSRIVSGFQGGEFNENGGFYQVRSSDAHAWVEYLDEEGFWRRADPTGFISPDRIQEGGHSFLNKSLNRTDGATFPGLRQIDQFFSNVNYKLSLFFDNFDREKQKELAALFNLKLKDFYWLGVLLAITFLAILFFKVRSSKAAKMSPEDKAFKRLEKKLAKKKIIVKDWMSEDALKEACSHSELSADYQRFLELYKEIKYGERKDKIEDLMSTLKNL